MVVGEVKIGVAERIEGRDRVRLKGNDETESLRPPELASNRQKNKKIPAFFPGEGGKGGRGDGGGAAATAAAERIEGRGMVRGLGGWF